MDEWSTPDLTRRVSKLSDASPSELSGLTGRVIPRLTEIDDYLSSFGDRPFDETALGLLRLAECALDAREELESRQPDPVDRG
jgi:hypothetical protein